MSDRKPSAHSFGFTLTSRAYDSMVTLMETLWATDVIFECCIKDVVA